MSVTPFTIPKRRKHKGHFISLDQCHERLSFHIRFVWKLHVFAVFFVVVVPCDLLSSNSREFHLFRAFNITSEYKLQAAKDLVWWKKNLVFWAVQFKGQSRWRKWVLIFLEIKILTGIFRVLCCFLCVFNVDVFCGSWMVEVIQTYVSGSWRPHIASKPMQERNWTFAGRFVSFRVRIFSFSRTPPWGFAWCFGSNEHGFWCGPSGKNADVFWHGLFQTKWKQRNMARKQGTCWWKHPKGLSTNLDHLPFSRSLWSMLSVFSKDLLVNSLFTTHLSYMPLSQARFHTCEVGSTLGLFTKDVHRSQMNGQIFLHIPRKGTVEFFEWKEHIGVFSCPFNRRTKEVMFIFAICMGDRGRFLVVEGFLVGRWFFGDFCEAFSWGGRSSWSVGKGENLTMLFRSLFPVCCCHDFSTVFIFDEIQGFTSSIFFVGSFSNYPSFPKWKQVNFKNRTLTLQVAGEFWIKLMEKSEIHHERLGFLALNLVFFQGWFCLNNLKYTRAQVTSKTSE